MMEKTGLVRGNFLHMEHSFADQSDSKSNDNNDSEDVRDDIQNDIAAGENVCINDEQIEEEDMSDTLKNDAKINSEKNESNDNSSLLESHL